MDSNANSNMAPVIEPITIRGFPVPDRVEVRLTMRNGVETLIGTCENMVITFPTPYRTHAQLNMHIFERRTEPPPRPRIKRRARWLNRDENGVAFHNSERKTPNEELD